MSVLMTAQLQYTAQNSSDNVFSHLQTLTVAHMLSVGGEGVKL